MEKIYSKIEPETLLHIIVRKEDMLPGRQDVVSEENFIQCSILNMEKGKTFRPHKHIWKKRSSEVIAQESWVCVKGSVKCFFYDIDDKILETHITGYRFVITTDVRDVIFQTNPSDYLDEKYFSGDSALERRFERLDIDEPSKENVHKILSGLKSRLEEYHKCIITDNQIAIRGFYLIYV